MGGKRKLRLNISFDNSILAGLFDTIKRNPHSIWRCAPRQFRRQDRYWGKEKARRSSTDIFGGRWNSYAVALRDEGDGSESLFWWNLLKTNLFVVWRRPPPCQNRPAAHPPLISMIIPLEPSAVRSVDSSRLLIVYISLKYAKVHTQTHQSKKVTIMHTAISVCVRRRSGYRSPPPNRSMHTHTDVLYERRSLRRRETSVFSFHLLILFSWRNCSECWRFCAAEIRQSMNRKCGSLVIFGARRYRDTIYKWRLDEITLLISLPVGRRLDSGHIYMW